MYGKNGRNEDKARQRNLYAKKHLQNDLEVQKDMERVHLQTIRNEKVRLQKELDRMRNKGQYMVKRHGHSNHTQRLLKLRLTNDHSDPEGESSEQEHENRARSGLPEITQSRKKSSGGEKLTMEERVIARRRREAEKMQGALVAKVGKLAEDFKNNNKTRISFIPRQRSVSPVRHLDVPRQSAASPTSKSDSFYTESRRLNRTRSNARSSIGEVDLMEAKNSVARRLMTSESKDATNARRASHMLPIETDIKPAGNNELPKNAEDLVFDQDMFAPDGHVRTVHLLPDPEEAFNEAKKARYLRLKGGNPNEKELTVGEIFDDDRIS